MFLEGNIYRVKTADSALRAALAAHVQACCAGLDPLEEYDAAQEAVRSLTVVQWLVRHLVPDFQGDVTDSNKDIFFRAIVRQQQNPALAAAATLRDARKWEAEHGGY